MDTRQEIEDINTFCRSLGWKPVVLDNAIKMLEMWKWIKEKIYTKGGPGISADIDRIEEKYFPKSKTRRKRINDMISNLNKLFNKPDYVGEHWKATDIIDLLIELRDEEEDV